MDSMLKKFRIFRNRHVGSARLVTGMLVWQVTRDKNVIKPAKGKRQCNCRNKVVTRQVGPGMFQQYTTQECEECQNVAYARQSDTLTVTVEPGTPDGHVSTLFPLQTAVRRKPVPVLVGLLIAVAFGRL